MKRFKQYSNYVIAFIFCVAVIAVYKTFDNLSGVTNFISIIMSALKPFVTAFVIAYVLNMPAKRLCGVLKRSKKKFLSEKAWGLSILAVYMAALVVFVLILLLLIPALYRNLLDFYNNAPKYISAMTDRLNQFAFAQRMHLENLNLSRWVERFFSSLDMNQLGKYAQGVFSVTSGVFSTVVAIIASIYMLIDKTRLQALVVRVLKSFVNEKNVAAIVQHARQTNEIFTNYIYARLVCCIVMAVVCSIVLMIMKVKYALVLGLFIGAMDMIPYFGSIIACVVSILVSLITGGFWQAVWVAVILLVLQQVDGNVLGPKIMGNSLEIRPFWIIFAVSVGGTLFGFIGMLISVPVIAIVRVVFSDYIASRERRAAVNAAKEEQVE